MRAQADSRNLPLVTESCMQGVNGCRPGCPLRLLTVHAQLAPPIMLSLSKHDRRRERMPRFANATFPHSETFAIPLPP